MLQVSAEKSTGDGAAVMVDEFSRKMKAVVMGMHGLATDRREYHVMCV
jgi:hypothetical protein